MIPQSAAAQPASSDLDVLIELGPLTPYATERRKEERGRMNSALRRAVLQEGISCVAP